MIRYKEKGSYSALGSKKSTRFNRASHINTGMDRPTKIFDF